MAYLPNKKKDGENSTPGVSSTGGYIGASGGPAKQAPQKKRDTGYTNIRQYLQANKPESANLVDPLVKPIEQQAPQIRTRIQEEQQGLQQSIQGDEQFYGTQNQPGTSVDISNQAIQQAGTVDYSQGAGKEQFDQFNRARMGVESEKDLIELEREKEAAKQTEKDAARTKTREGRQILLRERFKQPGYSSGQQKLDQMLLSKDDTSRNELVRRSQVGQGLSQQISAAEATGIQRQSDLDTMRLQQQTDLLEKLRGTRDGIGEEWEGGAIGEQTDLLEGQQAQAQVERETLDTISAKMNQDNRTATREKGATTQMGDLEAQKLGLAPGQTMRTYGIDMSQFINRDDITLSSVATSDQLNRYNSLKQLAGEDYAANILAEETGLAPDTWRDFKKDEFYAAVEARKQEYETQRPIIEQQMMENREKETYWASLGQNWGWEPRQMQWAADQYINNWWNNPEMDWGDKTPTFREFQERARELERNLNVDVNKQLSQLASMDQSLNTGISYGGEQLQNLGTEPRVLKMGENPEYNNWLNNPRPQMPGQMVDSGRSGRKFKEYAPGTTKKSPDQLKTDYQRYVSEKNSRDQGLQGADKGRMLSFNEYAQSKHGFNIPVGVNGHTGGTGGSTHSSHDGNTGADAQGD